MDNNYNIEINEYGDTVITALVNGHIIETFQASGRDSGVRAVLQAGESYTLDRMLSYFGNWYFEGK